MRVRAREREGENERPRESKRNRQRKRKRGRKREVTVELDHSKGFFPSHSKKLNQSQSWGQEVLFVRTKDVSCSIKSAARTSASSSHEMSFRGFEPRTSVRRRHRAQLRQPPGHVPVQDQLGAHPKFVDPQDLLSQFLR